MSPGEGDLVITIPQAENRFFDAGRTKHAVLPRLRVYAHGHSSVSRAHSVDGSV